MPFKLRTRVEDRKSKSYPPCANRLPLLSCQFYFFLTTQNGKDVADPTLFLEVKIIMWWENYSGGNVSAESQ